MRHTIVILEPQTKVEVQNSAHLTYRCINTHAHITHTSNIQNILLTTAAAELLCIRKGTLFYLKQYTKYLRTKNLKKAGIYGIMISI